MRHAFRTTAPLWGLAVAALLAGPAIVRGGLAGSPAAEVYGHAWVQWWAAEQWPAWPTGTNLAQGTESWPVIDALPTWCVAGLAQIVGSTAAWNAWVVVGIVLAAVGGGALARAMGGDGTTGAIGLATAPILVGSFTSGLTEDYALGIVALALAALLEDRPVRGGLLLGLSAWCGLYLAWLGAAAAVAIALWRWRAWRRFAIAGLCAAALALPAAAPFRERLAGVGHHGGQVVPRPEPLWRLDPWHGADLASFVAPGKVDTGGAFVREHPVYLGLGTLALAARGGWHPAVLAVLACVTVAPGDDLSFAGTPLGVRNPVAHAFDTLPFAARFNHHARVMLLGQMVLVMLAARGARRLPATWTRWAPALLFAETAFASPARLPLPTTPADTPAVYAALAPLPAGPVCVTGAAGPGIHPQKVFFDQRAHGRRLLHNPNRPTGGRAIPKSVHVVLDPPSATWIP